MFTVRLAQNFIRRVSNSDSFIILLNSTQPLQKSLEVNQIQKQNKLLIQYKTMATNINVPSTSSGSHKNRLALEKSPYLLQHATNPVNWYPWGDEAFETAKKENKLIFLSVGYSTCHWCHVMEQESFENESVAEIMNKYYVNIKVDREERPDIDRMYMAFIQAVSGSGGWPMSVFLTPDLKPISGGTYFPPEDKWGRPGFKTILTTIANKWETERDALNESGDNIIDILKKNVERTSSDTMPGWDCVKRCLQQFHHAYEPEYGGFTRAPKFPQPSNFEFLFYAYSRDVNSDISKLNLKMCLNTLRKMARGGINDHVSKGFARYSTDRKWHVPHFEKMLYDQGQLVVAYCNAYLITKESLFADVARDILTYVSRDLNHELGGFYSAEDADSYPEEGAPHKKEGAFCVWEYDEIYKLLTDKTNNVSDADIFCRHFNVKKNGNVDPANDPHNELTNKNVLIIFGSLENTADCFKLSADDVRASIDKSLKILYNERQKRPKPHLDSKIMTAWNSLMISAYAKAGEVLKDQSYTNRAIKAAKFIRQYLYNEETKILIRCCYRADDQHVSHISVPIEGFLDDYAYLIRSLIDLYEITLDSSWLEWAEDLQETQDGLFWDNNQSGYFISSANEGALLVRVKEDQDGAEPSGNSVSLINLLKLSAYLDRKDLKTMAQKLLGSFYNQLHHIPIALPYMMCGLILFHDSTTNILIVGNRSDPDTLSLLKVVRERYIPGRTLVLADGPDGPSSLLYKRIDILSKLKKINGKATAYICHHHACSLPVNEPTELINLLEDDLSVHRRY